MMNSINRVMLPRTVVTDAQANEFFKAVIATLADLNFSDLQHVYLLKHNAVVISFSGTYKPYIGYTAGYNRNKNEREYLPDNLDVPNLIADALRFREKLGGRVFIRKSFVFERDKFSRNNLLCNWDWQGGDPYIVVSKIYDTTINYFEIITKKG